jgi:molecular chaperone DnaK (HSP70)
MAVIIKRNTPIPCEKTECFVTVHDNQTSISIEVYEGERQLVKDNLFLDNFSINNLTKRKRGETGIYVTFGIDKDYSILNVTAKEEKERIKQNDEDDCLEKVLKKKNLQRINIEEINIKKLDNIETREITRKKRNEMEIERMIQEGFSMKNKDLEKRTRIEKINKIKGILYDLKNENNPLYEDNRNIIDKKVYQIKSWLENHQNDNINAYEEKIKEINDFIESL